MHEDNLDHLLSTLSLESSVNGKKAPKISLVNTESALCRTVKDLSAYERICFDAEGVSLSRTGQLTVAIFQGFGAATETACTPIYVVDVQTIGAEIVFPNTQSPSLRSFLEDAQITKVTFDCRGDSDALFHQYKVKLQGAMDLQVFHQAVRIHNGELPPKKNLYFTNVGVPYLESMEKVLQYYNLDTSEKSKAPHRENLNVWKDRPLTHNAVQYAGNDVNMIRMLWYKMTAHGVSEQLMTRVKNHSQRYEGMYRDRVNALNRLLEKDFIMEEHPIILETELPTGHPRKSKEGKTHTEQKWNKAVNAMKLGLSNAYNDVMYVLQHDDWYTEEGANEMRRIAANYPFTAKQRNRIANPPPLFREEDNDYYEDCSDYYEDSVAGPTPRSLVISSSAPPQCAVLSFSTIKSAVLLSL